MRYAKHDEMLPFTAAAFAMLRFQRLLPPLHLLSNTAYFQEPRIA